VPRNPRRIKGMSVRTVEEWVPLIHENLAVIEERIQAACDSSGRKREEVTLIAVSKTQLHEAILAAHALGLRHFGESRWQETETKVHALPSDITWHFIGKVQSNKAQKIAQSVDVIHTLENSRQLAEIAKQTRTFDGLIQLNISGEEQKLGIFPGNLDRLVEDVIQCKHVRFRGLMGIARMVEDPEECRAEFRLLRQEAERIGVNWLSMGMSHDLEVAIQEGSTHVRIGTALFGSR